ncbi:preprotein translocase K [Aeromonas bestiarum]|uniref:SctK family type III secretion system sorting platform protein n=1 Tax=Aeromonas bestiarum TaxID=105751 RepID=UPI000CD3C711|nr:SctK family type III secretion system sorting platform protein [Aeromonas bestiarum]POG23722.1 preprotein translocase K [Aeromonas bestiarum]
MVPGLTPYQLRFCPASYLHEAHFPLSWRWVQEILPDWRTLPASNYALLDELVLGIDYEMPVPLGGLALFPQAEFGLVLRRLGAMLHGEAIRHCLQASMLRQIIALLGEEGHRTLLSQLDLLIGPWPAGWQQYLPIQLDGAYLEEAGLQFWLAAAGAADPDWARRLVLRLPPAPKRPSLCLAATQLPLAQALCLKIAKQVTPQCCHLLK